MKLTAKDSGRTLDLQGQTITETWDIAGATNITILGGTWDGQGKLDYGIGVDNRMVKGPTNLRLLGVRATGFKRAGVKLTNVDQFLIDQFEAWAMGSDGIDLASCAHGTISRGWWHDFVKLGESHPDAIQANKALPPCDFITVSDCRADGLMQFLFGVFRNLTVKRNTANVAYQAINVVGDGEGELDMSANVVTSHAMAGSQSRISHSGFRTVAAWGNSAGAFGRKPAILDPRVLA